jgi:hypothetical protein
MSDGSGTSDGGKPTPRPRPYSPPVGPTNMGHKGSGLGGDNYGTSQQPVCRDRPVGSPGNGGTNHGNAGSQHKG